MYWIFRGIATMDGYKDIIECSNCAYRVHADRPYPPKCLGCGSDMTRTNVPDGVPERIYNPSERELVPC